MLHDLQLKADWLSNCQQTPIFNVFLHSGPIHVLFCAFLN